MGSIVRPFRWNAGSGADGAGLKEMSDADLEYLSYYFRLYYAAQLNTGHAGSIVYTPLSTHATTHPQIGSVFRTLDDAPDLAAGSYNSNWHYPGAVATDTRRNMLRNTNADDADYPPDVDYPTAPTEADWENTLATRNEWRILMTKRHADNALPGLPSDATYDADGYIVQNAAGNFQIDNTDADIAHTILKHSNTKMLSTGEGDELGTYRVASSTPGTGWTVIDGASNNEYMFEDTIMDYIAAPSVGTYDSVIAYKLYLKTSHAYTGETSAALTEPFGWDTGNGGSLKQKPITQADNIVTDILYPIYVQQGFAGVDSGASYGYPIYEWTNSDTVSAWEELRGTVHDTYYSASVLNSNQLTGGTYYTDRYGSGGTSSVIWYFKLSFPSTEYIRTLT